MRPDIVTHVRLPAPYVTNCVSYPDEMLKSQSGCHEHCLNKYYVRVYGKHSPFFRSMRMENKLIAFNVSEIHDVEILKCKRLCSQVACEEKYLSQSLTEARFLRMETINNEVSEVHRPKITPTEFLLTVLGNVGFWFGLCLNSIRISSFSSVFSICQKH